MIKKDYWEIKPHTERKLEILEKYLNAWCDILFSYYVKNPNWTHWKTPYYIDCFSGRGMYHKNGEKDTIKGSPLIAIEKIIEKKKYYFDKYSVQINPRIRLIEYDRVCVSELENFIEPYKKEIDIQVIKDDFNNVIGKLITETKSSPAFFFVDAGGVKELKAESVEKIVTKKGARDILLNYVVDGQIRIGGLAKSIFEGNYKGNRLSSAFKTIERLEDFTGMPIYNFLEETKNDYRDALLNYIQNVLHANNKLVDENERLQTIVYDMKDLKRQKLVYYLLFSSRKNVATKIMKAIFRELKKKESSQLSFFDVPIKEIKK